MTMHNICKDPEFEPQLPHKKEKKKTYIQILNSTSYQSIQLGSTFMKLHHQSHSKLTLHRIYCAHLISIIALIFFCQTINLL